MLNILIQQYSYISPYRVLLFFGRLNRNDKIPRQSGKTMALIRRIKEVYNV